MSAIIEVDRFALTVFDRTPAIPVEAAIVIAFGVVMPAIAVRSSSAAISRGRLASGSRRPSRARPHAP